MLTIATIRNCRISLGARCPKQWRDLEPTSDADRRHCYVCEQDVFFCFSDFDTLEHARAGHCIARALPADPRAREILVGRPVFEELPVKQAQAVYQREVAIDDALSNISCKRNCPDCGYPVPDWRTYCRVCGFECGRAMD
jgi:hypothetical protein